MCIKYVCVEERRKKDTERQKEAEGCKMFAASERDKGRERERKQVNSSGTQ